MIYLSGLGSCPSGEEWNAFTGSCYPAGQAPKTVLNTYAPPSNALPAGAAAPLAPIVQNLPQDIRRDAGPGSTAAQYNSARSVTISNADYNQEALEEYGYVFDAWQRNNGRRWYNGQFVEAPPPPPPIMRDTNFDSIYARILAGEMDQTPVPYYMGNAQAGQTSDYNAPLHYGDEATTTWAVDASGRRIGVTVDTPVKAAPFQASSSSSSSSNPKPATHGSPATNLPSLSLPNASSVIEWAKANPLMVAGIGAALYFGFRGGR